MDSEHREPAASSQPLLEIGSEFGRYRVLGALGAGGMGEVYLAEDRELGRRVAIKRLGGWLQDEDGAARFRREARTLASLNHPNIVTIYSVERENGIDFLTMELVEGPSLGERIAAGPMPLPEAIGIARQIADALGIAHASGVVHRDLKPANVKITSDGKVKVLDFGLAKRAVPAGAGDRSQEATLTRGPTIAGSVLGTPPYMSPEQARGEPVDERADAWAFGCVLYEMLAGRRAFPGRTAADVLAAILKDEPRWDALPPSTPPIVRDLIRHCLEKNPGQRLGDMAGASGALAELASGATRSGSLTETSIAASVPAGRVAGRRRGARIAVAALIVATVAMVAVGLWNLARGRSSGPSIRSIAVLPLTNASGKPDDQYFADGMTDMLIANLGSIEALKVISRTSVMAYRGGSKPLREIARDLKVQAIVEGSALRSGDRARITARLIDARTETILWSDAYERDMRDVMAMQGYVARAIAGRIQATLAPDVERRLTARPVRSDVYEDYLKGRFFLYQSSPEALQKAEEFFDGALKKDPAFALAHAGLADINVVRSFSGLVRPAEALEMARMHAVRAIQLDDQMADGHASLAWISFLNWDWVTAEQEFRRALQLNPGNALARINYAHFLAGRGRLEEALREGQRARELDPLSLPLHTAYAAVLIGAGRYDDAIAVCREALRMNPGFFWAHTHLWRAYAQKGRFEEALAAARASFSAQGDAGLLEALERGRRQAGYPGAMREAAETLAARARTQYVMALSVASLYAQAGEKKAAIDWLERAYQQHGALLEHIRISPEFKELRPDPRFQDLLRRLNLADDQIGGGSR